MNEYIIMRTLKIFFINIFTYFVNLKICKNKKTSYRDKIIIIVGSIIGTLIYAMLDKIIEHIFIIIILYFMQVLFLKKLINGKSLITINLISNAITYTVFVLAMVIELILMYSLEIKSKLINLVIILIIDSILLINLFKIKRIKDGFTFLSEKVNNEYIDIIMINISSIVILAYCLFGSYYGNLTRHILFSFIALGIIMLIMIQKTLTLYYKQRLLEKSIDGYKLEIKEKDEKIKNLSEEKFKISKLNHDFYNRQKAMKLKVQELVNNTNLNMETANELTVIDQIDKLTKEYSANLESIKNIDKLPSTEVEEIDDMFKYMQSECKKNNIDFKLQISGNIQHMVNKIIPQNKLVTLIGDHLRDAIIAINSGNNNFRSIISILGIKDNCYEFCVYDTGIEFEIETLLKLGLEPATTHKDSGGTGIGFMTTFETLKEIKASLIIEEKHGMMDNDYTKAVIIRFDNKNEYRIKSYRADKIKESIKEDRIIIENI